MVYSNSECAIFRNNVTVILLVTKMQQVKHI